MSKRIASRALAAIAVSGLLAGCQSSYDTAMAPQAVSYQRVAPDGRSGQRLGPDGYPLLGAFPNAAARQVDDSTVASQEQRAAALANRRGGRASSRGYDAEVARMRRLTRQQSAAVDEALAKKPTPNAVNVGTNAKPSRSPDEVLRRIESGD